MNNDVPIFGYESIINFYDYLYVGFGPSRPNYIRGTLTKAQFLKYLRMCSNFLITIISTILYNTLLNIYLQSYINYLI